MEIIKYNYRPLLLIFVFITGLPFQMCTYDNCNCPPFIGEYFDIKGFELINYKTRGDCCVDRLPENEVVNYNEYAGLNISYMVNYISYNNKCNIKSKFSLINNAYACSCDQNGFLGSKNEKLKNLTVITLNDFDENHLANDTINDLILVRDFLKNYHLNQYLLSNTGLIQYPSMSLKPNRKPVLDEGFKVKVIVELSTGEVYEGISKTIKLK